uniref:Nas2_N domain-containing protein n=1 Tax=Parastrongyloides trichosuri TaxID=131310 RepID=A0A0N4ZQM3_PARTI
MEDKNLSNECKKLMDERNEIDKRLEELENVLKENDCTMETPLVDGDGFPRNDIDVYTVRITRSEIINLRNDRKELNNKIEELLLTIHEKAKEHENINKEHSKEELVHRTSNDPFVKVISIKPHSPSDNGGLLVGDEIIQFGIYHKGNFNDLTQLSEYVKECEGNPIRITVARYGRPIRLVVTPQKWSGEGLFGANMAKI